MKWIATALAVFLAGCGGTSVSHEANSGGMEQSPNRENPKIVKRVEDPSVVVAGDDQHVLEGKSVTLRATPLDREKRFTKFVWKEGDRTLASAKQCELTDLGMGMHEILLEAQAADGTTYVDRVQVTIKGEEPGNALPEAKDLHFVTPEDTAFAGALWGSDSDGDPLRYVLVSLPEHGTLSGSPAHMRYIPDPDFYGEDSFLFKTNDGKIDSDLATVSITVEPRNDAPVANGLQLSTPQEQSLTATLDATDKEGDPLSFTVTQPPLHGTVTLNGVQMVYTPQTGFSGQDSFVYKANDGTEDSPEATVTIDVIHVNHPPVVTDVTVQMNEDGTLDIPLTAQDSDGDSVTFRLTSAPNFGTMQISGNTLHYQPDPDRFGIETVTCVANDGQADSTPATVTITVNAQNDAPVASPLNLSTNEDQSATVTLQATDVEHDPLSFAVVSQPQHGSVTISGDQATYTPDASYSGADSFSYKATDGIDDSTPATVSVTVNAVNHLPQLNDMSLFTAQDSALAITLTATDADNDPLTFFHDSPSHGTLSGSGANLTYTPQSGFSGTDTFQYWANDTHADSLKHTVTITVTAAGNSAPVASDQSVTVLEDGSVAITLQATDADSDPLTFIVTGQPQHGSVTQNGATVTYTPDANYNGTDTLTFTANDGTADSNSATVSIQVDPVNDKPTATAQSISGNEDSNLSIPLSGNDIDGDTLQDLTVVTQPSHGTLSCIGFMCTYAPLANFNGSDTFTYTVSDGNLVSDPATVSITVNAQNDAPVAVDQSKTLSEDMPVTISLNATDAENDSLTYSIVTSPLHGSVTLSGNSVIYTPALNYNGTDSFSFKANDGTVDSNIANVNLTINPVNDAPVATSKSLSVDEDNSLSVTLGGSDSDGDTLTYSVMQNPSNGTLSGTAPNLTYTPSLNFHGTDYFTYVINDGIIDSAEANVTITVNSLNDAPVANAGTDITVTDGTPVNLSGYLSDDLDGNITSYSWKEGTTLLSSSRDFSYTFPTGNHTITLTVTDNDGATASDTVQVTVESISTVSFTKITSLTSQTGAIRDIHVVDLDNDTDCDLVVVSDNSGRQDISWYRNDGNMTYVYMGAIYSYVNAHVVAIDDINDDNFPDIVYGTNELHVCKNAGDTDTVTFNCDGNTLYNGMYADDNYQAIVIADMDGVNGKDIVVSTKAMLEHKIVVFWQNSDHKFNKSNNRTLDNSQSATSLAAADNDNDGDTDLVFTTSDSDVFYLENDQNGTNMTESSIHTVTSTKVYFTDIDRDNRLDIVSVQGDSGTFQWDRLSNSSILSSVDLCSMIDIDNDSNTDLMPNFTSTTNIAWYQHNGDNVNPAFTTKSIDTVPSESAVQAVKAADLDIDGDVDIITGDIEGNVIIYRNNLQ